MSAHKVVRETINNGTTTREFDFIYDASGRPFAVKYTINGTTSAMFYYVLNLQGDVVKIIAENGTVMANYSYNAWGEVLSVTNASGTAITASGHLANLNPIRYRGYYYDTETGFYYLQSRYYDPTMHRFINADSLASTGQGVLGHNMFAYCRNNPVNYADANGQSDVAVTLTGDALAALTAWLSTIAATNWWNPLGWAAAAAIALFAVGVYVVADYLYETFLEENPEYIEVDQDGEVEPEAPEPPSNNNNNKNNKNNKNNNNKLKSENNTPRNNQAQNRQVKSIVRKFGMNKAQQRQLHDIISGQGYSYREIMEIASSLMDFHVK